MRGLAAGANVSNCPSSCIFKALVLTSSPVLHSRWADSDEDSHKCPVVNKNPIDERLKVGDSDEWHQETQGSASFANHDAINATNWNHHASEFCPGSVSIGSAAEVTWLREIVEFQKQQIAHSVGQIHALT